MAPGHTALIMRDTTVSAAEMKRQKKKLASMKRKAVAATEAHSLVESAIAGGIATISEVHDETIVVDEDDVGVSIFEICKVVGDQLAEVSTTEPDSAASESEQAALRIRSGSRSFDEACMSCKGGEETSKSTAVPTTPSWSVYDVSEEDDTETEQAEVNEEDNTETEEVDKCDKLTWAKTVSLNPTSTESESTIDSESLTGSPSETETVENTVSKPVEQPECNKAAVIYPSKRAQQWREELLSALASRQPSQKVQSLCASAEAVACSTEEIFVLDQMEIINDLIDSAEMHRARLWSVYQKYGRDNAMCEEQLAITKKFRTELPYMLAQAWCPETSPDQLGALCQSVPLKLLFSLMDTVSGRFRINHRRSFS